MAAATDAQVAPEPSPAASMSTKALKHALFPRPATAPGQSATQMPDGNWLLVGGSQNPSQLQLIGRDASQPSRVLPVHLSAPRTGHSATLLPDGFVLIFGGVTTEGAVLGTAEQFDPVTGAITILESVGLLPRAYHTATVLSDGRVLFAGGMGLEGHPLVDAELYNPETHSVEYFDAKLDRARLRDIAALAPDASVVLWGGVDAKGQSLAQGTLYDPASSQFSTIGADTVQALGQILSSTAPPVVLASRPAASSTSIAVNEPMMVRFSKRMAMASLNANTVTLIGPNSVTPVKPVPVENGVLMFVTPAQELSPGSSYTLFISGATDEAGKLLPFTAIGFTTVTLGAAGDSGVSDAKSGGAATGGTVAPSSATKSTSSGGQSSLAIPVGIRAASLVSAWKAVSVSDVLAAIQASIPTQASLLEGLEASDDSELWIPNAGNYQGQWISGHRGLARQFQPRNDQVKRALYGHPEIIAAMSKLTPAAVASGTLGRLLPNSVRNAPKGVTAIAGQVLRLNGRPLDNVTLSVGNRQVRTDLNGEFLLSGIPGGHQIMVIEGASANAGKREYGRFEYGLDVVTGQTNALPFVIWMPRLDSQDEITISSPTTGPTVLTNPRIPGLELRIPAGTVIRDAHGKIVTQISMTAIPTDQPPFPLPNVPVPVYFTVQPGGAHLEGTAGKLSKGAQLIYPNFTHSSPGARITFWDYDATSKGWYEYGQGTVTADGTQVMPDPGVVIYEFSGAMVSLPSNAPATGPAEGGNGAGSGSGGGDPDPTSPNPDPNNKPPRCGDPVDCSTGMFLNEETDLRIPDVLPIVLRRSYRPQDSASRTFGIGTNLSYDMFMVGDTFPYTYQDLILSDGGRIHFPRISPGTGLTDAVYQNTSTPGRFYGAVLKYDTSTGYSWTLTTKNGTIYSFYDSDASTNAYQAAVASIRDRYGNTMTLARSGGFRLNKVTSPNGRHLSFTYDSSNRVTLATDDIGRTVQYAYDTAGRLITVTDPAGNIERYTYDAANNMLTVTDKRANLMVTNTYDGNGRVSKQTYADSSTLSFAYTLDGNGKVTQTDITDQRGFVHREVFDANGYLTSVTRAVGMPEQQITTYTRDPATNLPSTITDALGRTTCYTYDALGNLTQATRLFGTANAVTTSAQYNSVFGFLTQMTDANGLVTNIAYDGMGNLLQITDPLNHASSFTYDAQGRPVTITDANGNTTSLAYFGSDLASMTDALGRKSFTSADAVGRVTSSTNPLGAQSTLAYDALDRLVSSADPAGNQIQFGYDPNGNRTSHTDANTNLTAYTFDALNRVLTKVDALSSSESYGYDPAGNPIRRTDRKQQISGWTYDGLGRLTQAGFGATTASPTAYTSTVSQTWDSANRLTQVVDSANGIIGRSYDALDRVTQETTVQGIVSYTYDAGGRRTSMTVQGQPIVSYTWDNANRLTQIQQAAGASNGNVVQTIGFQYDNGNRRTLTILGNGVHVAYAYDAANQLSGITYTQSNGSSIGNLVYGYDLAGHRTSVGGSLANISLPAAIASGVYNANNQLAQWNGVTYSYDVNGNLLNDGSRTYTWNARDQLASLGGTSTANFQYDAFGRRIGKTIGAASTGYVYDGSNFVQEKNGAGAAAAVTANLLTGRTDETFSRMTSTGIVAPLRDALGSTVAETNTAQAITANYSYEPYGATTQTGTATGSSQQYTGRENDNTGLYYYRARYYSQATGRFTQEDPIGWASGQANNYAYVGGNPISLIDPMGLETPTVTLYGMLPVQGADFFYFSGNAFGFASSFGITAGGDMYYSPPGLGLSKPNAPSAFGGMGFVRCPVDATAAQRERLANDILNGFSYSATAGYYATGGILVSPGTGTADLLGIGSPGYSVGGGISIHIGH